ncbi:MAG: hypothetical protein ACOX84_03085 [Methanothrix sp.]|uniref:hypothetical protein n=1 Tax=Methanothrix sp. TaxID=90426 RepID=UPI001BD6DB6C
MDVVPLCIAEALPIVGKISSSVSFVDSELLSPSVALCILALYVVALNTLALYTVLLYPEMLYPEMLYPEMLYPEMLYPEMLYPEMLYAVILYISSAGPLGSEEQAAGEGIAAIRAIRNSIPFLMDFSFIF